MAQDLPVKHLSPSQLELWNKCPRQWKFRYVDKMESTPWLAAWAGTAFHTWVQDWETDHMDPETYGLYFDDQMELERSKTDLEPKISQGDTEAAWRELGKELCRRWVEWRSVPGLNVVANEVEFLAPLPGLKLPIKGFVDAVVDWDQKRLVVDWKTGRKMPNATQIKIYGAILDGFGWRFDRVGYYNARTGKVATWHQQDYSLDDVALLFKPLDDGIQQGEYPATPGFHCKWCPGLNQCPEGVNRTTGRTRT